MSQPCLSGMCCCDMILPSEARRHGLVGGRACNANDPACGSPNHSGRALAEWSECNDDSALDFQFDQGLLRLQPSVINLTARESAAKYASQSVIAAKATDIGGILSNDPMRVRSWRKRYGVSPRSLVLVHQESRDSFQEKLWLRLRTPDSFGIFRELGSRIALVTSGFSVYDDGSMCEVRQVLNMRRSLLEAARANKAGLPSVPTLGWNAHRPADFEFLAAWCNRQGSLIETLAVNAQTGSVGHETIGIALGMARLEQAAGREYTWIVFGGRQRIERITEFIPRHRLVQVARQKDFQVPIRSKSGALRVQLTLS